MSIKPSVSKETIAKVVGVPTSQQNGLHNLTKNSKSFDLVEPSSTTDTSFSPVQLEPQPGGQNDSLTESSGLDASAEQHIRHLNGAVDALNIGDDTRPISASKPFDDSNPDTVLPKGDRAAFDSRTFSSNSETSSRRPPSIDGKSVTSGTNFALDEKESLRPDDSASVKAAEEEENLSAPSSRIGSETGVRAFRDQLQDIPERPRLQVHRSLAQGRVISPSNQRSNPQGSSPPQTGYDSTPVVAQPQVGVQSSGLPFGFTQQDPDEKLLEALDTPKDRLFILRLEQDVIDFVKDSKEPCLDLPPCNSFCRLLIHKLADYYFLTHFVDSATSSVRLYRTPYCRLPPPLTGISNPPTSENTPPPNGPAMKIMRRGIPGKEKVKSLHTSNDSSQSEAPSKSGSEAGGEFQGLAGDILSQQENEAANAKEKGALTREEREAKYREARERIFKGFAEKAENEDINANTEAGNEISRSSSQTGKARIPGRKPRSANDDGFEARSQFAAFYPAPDYHVQPSPEVAQYGAYPSQPFGYDGQTLPGQFVSNQAFSPGLSPTRQSQTIAPYTMQPDQLPLAASNGNMHQSFPPVSQSGYGAPLQPQVSPSLHHASSPAGYPPMNANHLPGSSFGQSSRSHPDQSHPFAPQPVRQSPYHSPAPHFANPHNSAMEKLNVPSTLIGMGNPYPYGQLPGSHTVQSSRTRNSQHPIPGSFNRNIFNPQTQSFVPTGGPFRPSSSASFNSSPGSNHPGNIQPPFTAHNTSSHYAVPSGFSSPHFSRPDSTHHPQTSHGFVNAHTTSPYQQPSNPNHQSHQSTLPKWNNPPNLPPKPPAPAITTQPPQAYAAALKASLPGYMPNGSYHAGSFPAQTHHAGQTARNDVREG